MRTYSTLYSTYEIWMYCIENELDICNISESEASFLILKFPHLERNLFLNDNSKSESQISKSDS